MRRIGTQSTLKEGELEKLKGELKYWQRELTDANTIGCRQEFLAAFDCRWDGQNVNGLRKDRPGELAWPFEGASDQRLRWGETIYLEKLALFTMAIRSCETEIWCGGEPDEQMRAAQLGRLLSAVLNSLGAKGAAEVLAMMHHMLVDSPAVAALDVQWRKRSINGVLELDIDDLQAEYSASVAAMGGSAEQAAINFRTAIAGEGQNGAAVENWLIEAKGINRKDVKKVMAALGEEGECEVLVKVAASEGPELEALRYWDDFCVPTATDDFDYANPWFRGEWVTESQLKERIAEQDWDAEWVKAELEHKGQDFFHDTTSTTVAEEVKDLVNICWCYMAETDDDGTTTRYVAVIGHADGSAFGKRAIRTRRGKWTAAFFRREVRTQQILGARGIAELAAPAQGIAKHIRDGAANNAIVGNLPPIKAKGSRVRNALIEPFVLIPMGVNDDLSFMQPPAYPASADKAEEKIRAELWATLGVSDGKTDVSARVQQEVDWFLNQWRDFLILLLETAQDNASDEYVMRATATADAKGVKSADVSGAFGITLKLDANNLDGKKLMEKAQTLATVLQTMDRKGSVDTDPVVRKIFTLMFPELAAASFKSAGELAQDDIKDEQDNFVKIKAGIMPQMDTKGGWNYEARLDWWRQMQSENPAAIEEMSAASQELAGKWIQALEMQSRQYGENAEIGRTGVKSVQAR